MILVTGAGGTVGSEVVKALKSSGAKMRACYNSPHKVEAARRAGLDAVAIDYGKPPTVAAALKSVERLFLLSAGGALQTDAEIATVKAAKEAGVKHVVKLSVWDADGEKYGFAKIHRPVERALEASGLAWTFLRPNGFMQNFVNFYAPTIKSQGAFYLPSHGCRVSHVDVRDIAAVAAKALTASGSEGKAYALSGPEALTYEQLAGKLSAAVGRPIRYVDISDADFKKGAMAAGMPEAYADLMTSLIHYYQEGHAARVTGDVERVTGRKPIDFDRFAREHAGAFK